MGMPRQNYDLNRVRHDLVYLNSYASFSISSSSSSADTYLQWVYGSSSKNNRGRWGSKNSFIASDTIIFKLPGLYELWLMGPVVFSRAAGTTTVKAIFDTHVNGVSYGSLEWQAVEMGPTTGLLNLKENFAQMTMLMVNRDDEFYVKVAGAGPSGVAWTIGAGENFRFYLKRISS